MTWFRRFAAWATLLAPICWLLYHPWQHGLAAVVNGVLTAVGMPTSLERVDVGAPFDVGLFVALCLASRRAPTRTRARALLVGVPLALALEVVFTSLSIATMVMRHSRELQVDPFMRAGFYLTDTIPWVSGAILWVALLGGWEMPAVARADKAHPRSNQDRRVMRRALDRPPTPDRDRNPRSAEE